MAEITAATVKELRERTGAGMMDCKKALAETNGEMEAAIDWLRAKGLAAAAKKAGRTAAEGLVGVAVEGKRGAVVEVNSETDFVAKNEIFQDFVRNVAKLALEHGTEVDALGAASYPEGGTVQEKLTDNIAKIGENQSLRRAAVLEVQQGAVIPYVHNQVVTGLGKIGVLVALESAAPADVLAGLGKQIAMHVAAAHPLALNAEDLDADLIERERSIAAPTMPLPSFFRAMATKPSAATRSAFLAALDRPLARSQSIDASMSPLFSVSAFLQSIMPTPDFSRSSFTSAAVISAMGLPPDSKCPSAFRRKCERFRRPNALQIERRPSALSKGRQAAVSLKRRTRTQ